MTSISDLILLGLRSLDTALLALFPKAVGEVENGLAFHPNAWRG